MGEVGFPRREFLYDIDFWEAQRIIAGYRKREQTTWEQVRWQTFWLLHNGMADLSKAGINRMTDLIKFPWEEDTDTSPLSDEDVDDMLQLMNELNEKATG